MSRPRIGWLLSLVLLLGCGLALPSCSSCRGKERKPPGQEGSGAAAAVEQFQLKDPAGLLDPALQGWMGRLAQAPAEFANLTRSSEGWNFFWEAELGKAAEAFTQSSAGAEPAADLTFRLGLARSLLELGGYHRQLYQATLDFLRQYLAEREQRRDKIGAVTPAEQFYAAQARLLHDGKDGAADAAARLKQLAANPAAGVFGVLARPWLGLALSLGGDAAGAEQAWKDALAAPKGDANLALLVAYTQARAGLWKGDSLPEADGSGYGRRLRVAALIRTGQLDQALHELASLRFRKPDHIVRLGDAAAPVITAEDKGDEAGGGGDETPPAAAPPAPAGGAAGGAAALDEEKTNLDFYAPYVFEELARLHLLQAARALENLGPAAGCAAYWRARALEALGDTAGALAAYQQVQAGAPTAPSAPTPTPAPGSAAPPAAAAPGPPDPTIACLVLDVHGTLADLAEDAGLRAALLQGKPLDGIAATSWANKLALVEGRAKGGAKGPELLAGMAFLPEDPRALEAALESAFEKKYTEKAVNSLFRGRFFEHYTHDLYRVQAKVAALLGERRLTVKVLESLHDNTQQDEVTTLNRPGFLLETALARWQANDPQGAAVLLNVLWKRYPEVWPTSEYVRRIRAFQALDNIKSGTPMGGN